MNKENDAISKNLIKKSLVTALIISLLSFFIPIVPYTKSEGLGLRTLPSPLEDLPQNFINTKFYGISDNPITALLLQFLIPFTLILLIFYTIPKKRSQKIIDFTRR